MTHTFQKLALPLFLPLALTLAAPAMADDAPSPAIAEAQALMSKTEFKSAIKVLTKAQEADNNFDINMLLIEAYGGRIDQVGMLKKRGLAIKMRKSMERALELRPDSKDARENLISFHMQAPGIVGGSLDTARELIKDMPGIKPAELHMYEGGILMSEDKPEAALAEFDKALAVEPEHENALVSKGNVLISQESYQEAFLTFETCTKIHPDNMNCHYGVGKTAHVSQTESDKGIAAMKTFIAANTMGEAFLAHAHYRLGGIYENMGNMDAAKAEYKTALTVKEIKPAKEALANLG